MSKRLFWRFKAHETGTFVAWDDAKRMIYRSDEVEGSEISVMMQAEAAERIDKDAYQPGMPIALQFGEASRWTSQMNGGSRWISIPRQNGNVSHLQVNGLVGCHCVTAITHANPRVALLSLHAMLDQFGVDDTMRHLRDFADGASSLQTEIDLKRYRGETGASHISIEKGMLSMHRRLSETVWIKGRSLAFQAQLPESVIIALQGRSLSTVLDHATTRDPALVIERMQANGEQMTAWTDRVVTVAEAIAIVDSLASPLTIAA